MSEFRTSVFSNKVEETYQPEKEVNTSKKVNVDFRPVFHSKWVLAAVIVLVATFLVNLAFFNNPTEPQPKPITVRHP